MNVVSGSIDEGVGSKTLSVANLWKCYLKDLEFVVILDDISFDIDEGEFVCIVGPSGCGKSTLLSIMAGLEPATTGSVLADGLQVSGALTNNGFVFQRDLLLEWRTVLDNVLLPYQIRGESVKPHADRASELLASVGLEGSERLHPWQLSGGMRQRVAICRALIRDPDVIFMDEPFGALDALTRERLNDDLLTICGSSKTVVFVTHDVAESVFLGTRVLVMGSQPGRIYADIPIDLPKVRRPEMRDEPEFAHLISLVRGALRDEELIRHAGMNNAK